MPDGKCDAAVIMQVRKTVAYTIIVLIVAMGLAIIGGMQLVMIPAVEHIESREASENVLRPVRVVEDELVSLEGTALDWGRWDDTYFFVHDREMKYIDNNLINTTFTSLHLDLMLYYDLNGTLFYGKGYDFEVFRPLEIPEGLYTNPGKSQIEAQGEERGEDIASIQGILNLPEGLLLVSINPILKSDSTGPVAGYLGVGRYLDTPEIRKIAYLTSTNLSVRQAGDPEVSGITLPAIVTVQKRPTYVRVSGDGSTISSFALMGDMYGMPAAVFRVDSPRATYRIAQESMLLFFYLIAVIGCVSIFSVMYSLDRSFLSRLSFLEMRMKEIADRQDFSERIDLSGDDELTSLSSRIDRTLDALEEHIIAERAAVERARIANEKLNLLSKITRHDILNQVTVIRGFADLSRESLPLDSPAIQYLDRIGSASATIEDQLAFTREYEIGGAHANPAWFNIRDLIAGVVRKMVLGAVEVQLDTGDLEVFSDPLLEKIVYNLVDNSIKHGEKVTRIRLSFREDGESGVLIYEDNGVGIPHDQKERIFEQGVGRHLGLGLFLTRGILSVTGITISETGVQGEGARFDMRIPKGLFRVKKQ